MDRGHPPNHHRGPGSWFRFGRAPWPDQQGCQPNEEHHRRHVGNRVTGKVPLQQRGLQGTLEQDRVKPDPQGGTNAYRPTKRSHDHPQRTLLFPGVQGQRPYDRATQWRRSTGAAHPYTPMIGIIVKFYPAFLDSNGSRSAAKHAGGEPERSQVNPSRWHSSEGFPRDPPRRSETRPAV